MKRRPKLLEELGVVVVSVALLRERLKPRRHASRYTRGGRRILLILEIGLLLRKITHRKSQFGYFLNFGYFLFFLVPGFWVFWGLPPICFKTFPLILGSSPKIVGETPRFPESRDPKKKKK